MRITLTKLFLLGVALPALFVPAFAANEKNYTYLALGDSVAFGYISYVNAPPDSFIGYPEVVADAMKLLKSKKLTNSSCPGQSSFSFLYGGLDIGCEGIRSSIGLKTNYTGTQMEFALSELKTNKHINLVTLNLGGNDLSLLQVQCANPNPAIFAACVQVNIGGVLASYAENLGAILGGIRYSAGYTGTLVLLTQYSPSGDPIFLGAVAGLNAVAATVSQTPGFNVRLADGFTPFLAASAPSGDPCTAGLLVYFPGTTTCDIHPSKLGRELLAAAVLNALDGAPKK